MFSIWFVFSLLVFSCDESGTTYLEEPLLFSPKGAEIVYVGADYTISWNAPEGCFTMGGMRIQCFACRVLQLVQECLQPPAI